MNKLPIKLPYSILTMEGKFRCMGLNIVHDGYGRVVISDDSKEYSDADYESASSVEYEINKIIKRKYDR